MIIVGIDIKDPEPAIRYNEEKVTIGKAECGFQNFPGDKPEEKVAMFKYFGDSYDHPLYFQTTSHLKVSFLKGEVLTKFMVKKLSKIILNELGYSGSPYLAYIHFDTETPHFHLVISRVNENFELTSSSFSALRCIKLSRRLEIEFNFIQAKNRKVNLLGLKMPGYFEHKLNNLKGIKSATDTLRDECYEALKLSTTFEGFVRCLERRGVQIFLRETIKNEKLSVGVSYQMDMDRRIGFIEQYLPEHVRFITVSSHVKEQLTNAKQSGTFMADIPGHNDVFSGSIAYNKLNLPELCPEETRLREFKIVRAKAFDLGPILMWESIIAHFPNIDPLLVEKLKVKNKDFSRPFFSNQDVVQKLALAIEKKMPGGVHEAIREGASINADVIKEGLSQDDLNWTLQVIAPRKDTEQSTLYNEMLAGYRAEHQEPTRATKFFALTFIKGGWDICYGLLSENKDFDKRPDPRIVAKFLSHVNTEADVLRFHMLIEQYNKLLEEARIEAEKQKLISEAEPNSWRSIVKEFDPTAKNNSQTGIDHPVDDENEFSKGSIKESLSSDTRSDRDTGIDSEDQDSNRKRGIGY